MNEYSLNMKLIKGNLDPGALARLKRIFQINQPYNSVVFEEKKNLRNIQPMTHMHLLINVKNINAADRIMVMTIDEFYILEIYDFTDHKISNPTRVAYKDLKNTFRNYLNENLNQTTSDNNFGNFGNFSHLENFTTDSFIYKNKTEQNENLSTISLDFYCSGLTMVKHNSVYTVPCYYNSNKFFLWIVTQPSGNKFIVSSFLRRDDRLITGNRNPNIITAYSAKFKGKIYLVY